MDRERTGLNVLTANSVLQNGGNIPYTGKAYFLIEDQST